MFLLFLDINPLICFVCNVSF